MNTTKTMRLLLFIIILLTTSPAFCQIVEFKKKIVSIDGTACLKIKDSDLNNVSFVDMDGHEVLFLKYVHDSKYGSLYNKIIFMDYRKSFTTKTYIFTQKLLIKKLIDSGVIKNCKIDTAAMENFIMKYDENVEVDY